MNINFFFKYQFFVKNIKFCIQVAIELPSRKIWTNFPYELAQLTTLSILLTNLRVYIVSDTPKTEGSHAQDFQKRLDCVREIAANIANGKIVI